MDDEFDIDDEVLLEVANQVDKYLDSKAPRPEHIEFLQSQFGHNKFRPKQWDIIRTIIEEKRDNLVIMPTGYGKSLCFQYPAVFTNGITLVVSPLISLMQDQVRAMSVANISSCFLGSAQTDRTVRGRALNGEFRLVYVSPEYLGSSYGKEFLKSLEKKLTLIAIDEAHAISQWGHDFRPDYRKLSDIRRTVPSVPILAVTATAAPRVRDDIASNLRLKNPQIICMGFDRPNIRWADLKPLTTQIRGSVIIYVLKKATSAEIATILRENGVTCEIYHAGLSVKKRAEVLDNFTKDRLRIIVATVAFGMGIDKPDVRSVIHYGCSKNIETYVQETGRAGRDGLQSKAITFFDDKDFQLHEFFLNNNYEHHSETVLANLRQIGMKMRDLCHTLACRRKFILEYFGSDTTDIKPRKNCCDNCDQGSSSIALSSTYENLDENGFYDFTHNGYLFLKAIQKKAMEFKHVTEIFGAGKIWSKEYWTALTQQLKQNGYLTMKQAQLPKRPFIVLTQMARDWLQVPNRPRLILKAIPEMYKFFVKKRKAAINNNLPMVPSTSYVETKSAYVAQPALEKAMEIEEDVNHRLEFEMSDQHLEEILLGIRTVMAENSDCMPNLVASNIAIKQMVEKKPVSAKEFKSSMIDGFSVAKIEKFAGLFIDGIIKFMNNEFCLNKILQKLPLRVNPSKLKPNTRSKLQRLIDEKKSLEIIQKELNLSDAEAIDELIILIRIGCPIRKEHLFHLVGVYEGMFNFIKGQATDDDLLCLDELDEIKGKFCDKTKITEQMLNVVLNYLKVRQLLNSLNVPYFDVDENKLMNGSALLNSENKTMIRESESSGAQESAKIDEDRNKRINLRKFEYKTNSIGDRKENEPWKLSQTSQNHNQMPSRMETNKIEVEKIIQPPTKTDTKVAPPQKRVTVKAASKVKYMDSSDSDDEPETKRSVPQWVSVKRLSSGNLSKSQGASKKASF